jgi:hypothetical protein
MPSQQKGSTFEGITKTVAIPIASPNSESAKQSFQLISSHLRKG